MAWVQAEIDKSNRYWSYVRDRIRAGVYRMTAAAMRAFGFDEDEIARLTGAELTPRTGTGTVAYKSIDAGRLVMDARRLVADGRGTAGMPIDRDTGMADPGAKEARIREVSRAAATRYAETGDASAAMAELRAALDRTRSARE